MSKPGYPLPLIPGPPGTRPPHCARRAHLLTMVAPHALAMRLLSVLRSRRMAEMPALVKKCAARSERPFSVMTTSGLNAMIWSHWRRIVSSSALSRAAQSSSCRGVGQRAWGFKGGAQGLGRARLETED